MYFSSCASSAPFFRRPKYSSNSGSVCEYSLTFLVNSLSWSPSNGLSLSNSSICGIDSGSGFGAATGCAEDSIGGTDDPPTTSADWSDVCIKSDYKEGSFKGYS